LRLTQARKKMAAGLSMWANTLKEHLTASSPEEKEIVMRFLMRLIASLQGTGVITVSRMCVTCRFFRPDEHPGSDSPHHCVLLDSSLAGSDLRINCPEHELVTY